MSPDSLIKVAEDILLTAASVQERYGEYELARAMVDEAQRILRLMGTPAGSVAVWVPDVLRDEWIAQAERAR